MNILFKNKKRLGQNFLINEKIQQKICSLTKIENEEVLEVGPGKGYLTKYILKQNPSRLILIEKDCSLQPFLSKIVDKKKQCVELIFDDILKIPIFKLSNKKITILANLPYNIATTLILNWLPHINSIKTMILMVQKEVALRLSAQHKTKEYGRISVLAQLLSNIEVKIKVEPENFFPKPKVDSAVLKIVPQKKKKFNYESLDKTLKLSFLHRRKTLRNNLKKIDPNIEIKISKCGIDPNLRPEEITPLEYIKLSEELF